MGPTDKVEENWHPQHNDQPENGSPQAAEAEGEKEQEQTNGGGENSDSYKCSTGGHAGTQGSEATTGPSSSSGGEHEKLLSKMRSACEKQSCSTKDVSNATLLRFLKARSMKVDKAAKMFVNHQKWRASYVPLGYVPDCECPRELAAKKFFLQGRSRLGWAITVVHCRFHLALERNLEELKRAIIYVLDKSIASASPEAAKVLIIVDLKDIGYKNLDARAFMAGFGFLQRVLFSSLLVPAARSVFLGCKFNGSKAIGSHPIMKLAFQVLAQFDGFDVIKITYYPERLARCLMINAPSIFMGSWKVINRFLDPETRSKVVFVQPGKVTETCLSDIPVEVLPAVYGGKAELTLLQDAVVPNWPPSSEAL